MILSEEAKKKISNKLKGRKRPASAVLKQKETIKQKYTFEELSEARKKAWMNIPEEKKKEIAKKQSNSHKGRVFDEVTIEKIRNSNLGLKRSDETKDNMRKAQIELNKRRTLSERQQQTSKARAKIRKKLEEGTMQYPSREGINNNMYGKPCPHAKKTKYGNIWFRSSWEATVAKWFDEQGVEWVYEPKRFVLGDVTYVPDFYLPSLDCYVEVKGWLGRNSKDVIRIRRFKEKYALKMITQQHIRDIEKGVFVL